MCGFYHQDERDEAVGKGCLSLVLVAILSAILAAFGCTAS